MKLSVLACVYTCMRATYPCTSACISARIKDIGECREIEKDIGECRKIERDIESERESGKNRIH